MKIIDNSKDDFEREGEMFHHINSMYFNTSGYEKYWQNRRKDLILSNLKKLKNNCNSLLEIGCAEGFFIEKSVSLGYSSVGCDISHLKLLKSSNIDVVECDAQNLPFKSNSFDVVLLNRVLELIPDDIKALNESIRVCRKFLIITVPNQTPSIMNKLKSIVKPEKNIFKYEWGVKARSYNNNQLKKILKDHGTIIELKTIAPFGHAFLTPSNNINRFIYNLPIKLHETIDNNIENWLPFNFGHDIICIVRVNE